MIDGPSQVERAAFRAYTAAAVEQWSRDWHLEASQVARETARRIELHTKLVEAPELATAAVLAYERDPIRFIEDCVFTYDPRARRPLPKTMPFSLWDRQKECIRFIHRCYVESASGGIKKSRDLGVTWICAAYAVWLWRFSRSQETIKFGSRKLTLVDQLGNMESIFEKVRFILRRLPDWLLPVGFELGGKFDNHTRIINPVTKSSILAEAGSEMGRGGRSSIYFIDEFAKIALADSVWAAVTDNSDVVIPVSTSGGTGTKFWQLELQRVIRFFRFHYSDDPRKDEKWKRHKLHILGPTNFEREHEMNDEAALDFQIIEPQWVTAATTIELPETGFGQVGIDPADTGEDETGYASRVGPVVKRVLASNEPLTEELFDELASLIIEDSATVVVYDRIGVGAGTKAALGPHIPGIDIVGVANNESPPKWTYLADDEEHSANERFASYDAFLWWSLRIRLQNTYEVVEGIAEHPPEECVSLPDDPLLIAQLTSRQWYTRGDRIAIESKDKMKKRGIASPDRAESVVYAFAPVKRRTKSNRKDSPPSPGSRSRVSKVFKSGW